MTEALGELFEKPAADAGSATLAAAAAALGVVRSVAEVDPFDLGEDEETLVIGAQLLKVSDPDTFTTGGTLLVAIKRMIRTVEAHYSRYLDPLNAVRGEILELKRADLAPLAQAKENLEPQIARFDKQQKDAAAAEQRRQQDEANERARQDQLRAAASVERVADQTEDPRSKKALLKEAEAIKAAPTVAPKVDAPQTVKVPGLNTRFEYRAEIADPMLVIRCIIAGKLPITAIEPERLKQEHPALDKLAQALGPQLEKMCPGIKVVEKPIVTGR